MVPDLGLRAMSIRFIRGQDVLCARLSGTWKQRGSAGWRTGKVVQRAGQNTERAWQYRSCRFDRVSGFRPVLYDASFAEWGNEFSAPIETGNGGRVYP